jgi:uncharacterized protein
MSMDGAKAAEEVVRAMDTAILVDGDFDRAMEYAHRDYVIREAPGLPFGGDYRGRAGLDALLAAIGGHLEFVDGLRVTYHGIDGSTAIARLSGRALLLATGEEYDFLVVEWVTLREGKVAEVVPFYYDQAGLLGS